MTYLAQVTLLASSGNSADNNTNVFYVSESGVMESEMDAWTTALKTFYDSVYNVGGMRGFAQNGQVVKFYDIDNPAPNYPVYETTWNFAVAATAQDLPMELCLAASYKNNSNNTVLRARRRGRIYLSGWSEASNTAGRPTSTAYEGVANAYAAYCDDVNVIGSLTAVIYSRVQDVQNAVEEVWCDNEWDTQRRRGGIATTRHTVSVTP